MVSGLHDREPIVSVLGWYRVYTTDSDRVRSRTVSGLHGPRAIVSVLGWYWSTRPRMIVSVLRSCRSVRQRAIVSVLDSERINSTDSDRIRCRLSEVAEAHFFRANRSHYGKEKPRWV